MNKKEDIRKNIGPRGLRKVNDLGKTLCCHFITDSLKQLHVSDSSLISGMMASAKWSVLESLGCVTLVE